MFAKYRRSLECAIDRIDNETLLIFHHVSASFSCKSAFSDLDLELSAYADEECTSRIGINLKSILTLESLNEEQHNIYLKWIHNCKQHAWPVLHYCASHKDSEQSIKLDICRSILLPLSELHWRTVSVHSLINNRIFHVMNSLK